jgi:hypothetical protein
MSKKQLFHIMSLARKSYYANFLRRAQQSIKVDVREYVATSQRKRALVLTIFVIQTVPAAPNLGHPDAQELFVDVQAMRDLECVYAQSSWRSD